MSRDILLTNAYMIMDASQEGKRLYWSDNGWVGNPCVALRSLRRGWTYDHYSKMGCQAALVMVKYSRIGGVVFVHQIVILHRTQYD